MGTVNMMLFISTVLVLSISLAGSVSVSTKYGHVRGSQREYHGLHKNGSYHSFQGIPYAVPPVGSLRFKDPVPWTNVWDEELDVSGGPPAVCPQPNIFDPQARGITGNEDCLYLNIYTEEVPTTGLKNMELKPVMFFIHGGGFVMGSGAQMGDGSGSDFLLESGMVVVTINYRLGALGFLAIEGTSITGNQAMKDQLLAMRWVKENIANFGGDPGRITISGESAGAISVHAHVLSPMGKNDDLFQKAISFSGTMLMLRDFQQPLIQSKKLFRQLCKTTDEDEIPEDMETTCLYDITPETFVKEYAAGIATTRLPVREQVEKKDELPEMFIFWPVVDDWADEPFLPSHPITILHNQQQKMVPFMTGINKDEGAMNIAPNWKNLDPEDNQFAEFWGDIGAQYLFFVPIREMTFDDKLTARMVAQFYVGENGIKRENKQGLTDMFTDAYFAYPNTETVKLHAKASAPVYNYVMSYRGSASFAPLFAMGDPAAAKEDFGVAHADDLMYLFRMSFGNFSSINTENDEKFVEIWQQLIGNFARYGNPTPVSLQNIPNWPTAQNSRAACVYLDIGLNPEEKHRMFAERMQFWNKLFFEDLLEKYAISEQDDELLAEIDTVIVGSEEDESEEEDHNSDAHKQRHKHGNRKRKGNWRKNMKNKMFRKQRRLAKKLKQLKCN